MTEKVLMYCPPPCEKVLAYGPERGPLPEGNNAGNLILDCPVSRNVRNKFLSKKVSVYLLF